MEGTFFRHWIVLLVITQYCVQSPDPTPHLLYDVRKCNLQNLIVLSILELHQGRQRKEFGRTLRNTLARLSRPQMLEDN